MNVYQYLGISIPMIGFIIMMITTKHTQWSIKSFLYATIAGFLISASSLFLNPDMHLKLSFLLSSLILFVSLNVQKFSIRYMNGDSHYKKFFIKLAALTLSANSMVLAPTDTVFWMFWTLNGLILSTLMAHKNAWRAAKYSGIYTAISLGLGSVSLAVGFLFPEQGFAKYCLLLAAMIQSAIWPMHRWLLSSLNSPTPVSALMHAGIVNGGGILLVKYHDQFIQDPIIMSIVFGLGLITAIVASFWKLIQVDIKKMLANSTMAQMGFMFMQCGMGLYSAAIAHLCWHGLFKAYLFLNSGSAVNSPSKDLDKPSPDKHHFQTLMLTVIATISFIFASNIHLQTVSTQWILLGMFIITAWQMSKGLLGNKHLMMDMGFVGTFSGLYGLSLKFIDTCFINHAHFAQPLRPFFIFGFALLTVLWLCMNSKLFDKIKSSKLWAKLYINGLNASQPYAKTQTAIRQSYQV